MPFNLYFLKRSDAFFSLHANKFLFVSHKSGWISFILIETNADCHEYFLISCWIQCSVVYDRKWTVHLPAASFSAVWNKMVWVAVKSLQHLNRPRETAWSARELYSGGGGDSPKILKLFSNVNSIFCKNLRFSWWSCFLGEVKLQRPAIECH